jgi:hypothetical protein
MYFLWVLFSLRFQFCLYLAFLQTRLLLRSWVHFLCSSAVSGSCLMSRNTRSFQLLVTVQFSTSIIGSDVIYFVHTLSLHFLWYKENSLRTENDYFIKKLEKYNKHTHYQNKQTIVSLKCLAGYTLRPVEYNSRRIQ